MGRPRNGCRLWRWFHCQRRFDEHELIVLVACGGSKKSELDQLRKEKAMTNANTSQDQAADRRSKPMIPGSVVTPTLDLGRGLRPPAVHTEGSNQAWERAK